MRKLKLESGVWRYRVDEYYDRTDWLHGLTLELITPAGRRVKVPNSDAEAIATIEPNSLKKQITPGAVRRYIEERLDTL